MKERVGYHEIGRSAKDLLGILARRSIFQAQRWSMRTHKAGRATLQARNVSTVIAGLQQPQQQRAGTMNSEARKRLEAAGSGSDAEQVVRGVNAFFGDEQDPAVIAPEVRAPGYRTAEYIAYIERGMQAPKRDP